MPETAKSSVKSIQISKIAREVNRQSGEVLEYLKRIGVEVSGIMSKVDETAYHKALGHFKTDIEEVEKHKQKLMDFKKRHNTVEINEIEGEVKKEKEKKQKEEEERQKKVHDEERVRAEREARIMRELDEKRRLIEQKKEEIEREKEEEKRREIEALKAEEEKKRKAAEPKEVKKEEPATEQPKPVEVVAAKEAPKKTEPEKSKELPKKPEFKKPEYKKDFKKPEFKKDFKKPEFKKDFKKPDFKKGDFKKPDFRKPDTKKEDGKKEEHPKYKKPDSNFERVTIKEDFHKPKKQMPGGFRPRHPFKKPFVSKKDEKLEEEAKAKKAKEAGTTPPLTVHEERKRDIEKKAKAKRQRYSDGADTKKRQKKFESEELTHEIEEAIRETMAKMDETGTTSARAQLRRKKRKERIEQEEKEQQEILARANVITVTEFLSTSELSTLMAIDVSQLIQKCFELGLMVTINQRLDRDLIILLADEFGFKVEFQKEYEIDLLADFVDTPEKLVSRPPVVTIMGHVDHGKTSLLDYIRKANVVAGEAGGITQHIGAYQVRLESGKLITFLDTPGHEAFTAMRARGAQITDIVVLVVAADDSVMPQTVEAINHALAANVPIVVAINKIDKPNSDPLKIKTQLSDRGILVEEWGGKYQSVEISAKAGTNIPALLEKILLEAEILDLKANPNRNARGAIVEAKLDRGKGIIGTVLVQKGTLKMGDSFVAGVYSGRVKAMFDERGRRVEVVKPATPVQLLGFDGMPQAGDVIVVLESERDVKEISIKRQQLKREQDFRQIKFTTLDDISKQIKEGKQVDLNVIIKGDVDGSVEALSDSLLKLGSNEVKVSVIHRGIGEISENDVLLAAASGAIVFGFNVRPNLKARKLAESEKVDIRMHNIIYDVINEVKLALEGLLEPEKKEEILSTIEVRDTFKVPKIGMVAGCYVVDGKVSRGNKVRLLRDGFVIFDGNILALKRFKDDVRDVEAGYECGLSLENFNDIKVGDIIETYKIVEIKRKLEA